LLQFSFPNYQKYAKQQKPKTAYFWHVSKNLDFIPRNPAWAGYFLPRLFGYGLADIRPDLGMPIYGFAYDGAVYFPGLLPGLNEASFLTINCNFYTQKYQPKFLNFSFFS